MAHGKMKVFSATVDHQWLMAGFAALFSNRSLISKADRSKNPNTSCPWGPSWPKRTNFRNGWSMFTASSRRPQFLHTNGFPWSSTSILSHPIVTEVWEIDFDSRRGILTLGVHNLNAIVFWGACPSLAASHLHQVQTTTCYFAFWLAQLMGSQVGLKHNWHHWGSCWLSTDSPRKAWPKVCKHTFFLLLLLSIELNEDHVSAKKSQVGPKNHFTQNFPAISCEFVSSHGHRQTSHWRFLKGPCWQRPGWCRQPFGEWSMEQYFWHDF